MIFEVASFRHLADETVYGWPVERLLRQYEWIDQARWNDTETQITATEVGVMRALARAFGEDKLPALPTYDEVLERQEAREHNLPQWMREFERVNVGRAKQTGSTRL